MESTCPVRSQRPCPGHSGKLSPLQHSSSFHIRAGLQVCNIPAPASALAFEFQGKSKACMYKSLDLVRFHGKTCMCMCILQSSQLYHFLQSQQLCISCKKHGIQFLLICTCFWMFAGCTSNSWFFNLESHLPGQLYLSYTGEPCCCVIVVCCCLLVAKWLRFSLASGCTCQASRLGMWVPSPKLSFVLT